MARLRTKRSDAFEAVLTAEAFIERPLVEAASAGELADDRAHAASYRGSELRRARHILIASEAEATRIRGQLTDANVAAMARRYSTRLGWEIIQVTRITPPRNLSFGEVRSSIIESRLAVRRQAAVARWLADAYEGWRKRTVYADGSLLPAPSAPIPTGVTVTGVAPPAASAPSSP